MNNPVVSVITPCYNAETTIAEAIESIQAQTFRDWELLITDDCSTDNTREIINRYAVADPRIRLFTLEVNSGAGVARNNSISEARGRFIAFCDADDRWYSDKLEKQLDFMTKGGFGLTYTSYMTSDESGNLNGFVKCLPCLTKAKIIRDNGIGCLTAMYDSHRIGKHYMPSVRKRQDWCLWIDIISKIGKAHGLQEPLALYRIRSGSISSNKIEMLKYNFNVYHQICGYNKLLSAAILGGYFLPYYFYKKFKQKRDYMNRITPPQLSSLYLRVYEWGLAA